MIGLRLHRGAIQQQSAHVCKFVVLTMPKYKTQTPTRRAKTGRKRLADHGLEKRDRKVLASFTPTQHERLEAEADDEGVTVAELVAQRAVTGS